MDKLLISSTFLICRQDGKVVANCAPMDIIGISSDVAAGYARRLVACWNACDGISTESLERGIVGQIAEDMKLYAADRDRLQALNAELVGALERAGNGLQMIIDKGYDHMKPAMPLLLDNVSTALAKAKETVK